MTTSYYNYGSRSPEAHGGASICLAWSRKNVAMLLLAIATTNVNFAIAGSGPLMASGAASKDLSRRCRSGRQGSRWWGARATGQFLPSSFSSRCPLPPSFVALVAFLFPSFSCTRCPPSLLLSLHLLPPCSLVFLHSLPLFPPRFLLSLPPLPPPFSALVAILRPSFFGTRCPPCLLFYLHLPPPFPSLFFYTRRPTFLLVFLHCPPQEGKQLEAERNTKSAKKGKWWKKKRWPVMAPRGPPG